MKGYIDPGDPSDPIVRSERFSKLYEKQSRNTAESNLLYFIFIFYIFLYVEFLLRYKIKTDKRWITNKETIGKKLD